MRYEKSEFSGARIELDGNEYIGCTFISCTFVYRASGPVILTDNDISGNTNFELAGAAGDTVNFLKGLWRMGEFGRAITLKTFRSIAPDFKDLH
jgi:hypothetical protein